MKGADQSSNADLSHEVEQPDEYADYEDACGNHKGVLADLLGSGPYDLLQLAAELAEVSADSTPGSFEPVFLLDFSHDKGRLLLC